MKAAVLERPHQPIKKLQSKVTAGQEQSITLPGREHQRRIIRPRYWEGEFNGLWCDEEWY